MKDILTRLTDLSWASPKNIRLGLWGMVFALIAALGYTGGSFTAFLIAARIDTAASRPVAPPVDVPVVRQRKPIAAFNPILEANVFRARRSPPGSGGGEGGPTGPLRLTLTGTFIFGRASFAFVIGPDGRTERAYQLGDCIPEMGDIVSQTCAAGQGKLTKVESEQITVSFGGQTMVVKLKKEFEDGGAEIGASSPPPSTGQGQPPALAPAMAGALFPHTRNGNTVDMRLPSTEVNKAFENFAEITKQARVIPYTVNNNTTGFQIQKILPGSVFQRIGLQDNDIIKGVNGTSLTSADQALRLFTMFRNEREVVLDIQRGAQTMKLSYTIE